MMTYLDFAKQIGLSFRKKRFSLLTDLIQNKFGNRKISILDLGGRESFWESMDFHNSGHRFCILNTKEEFIQARNKNFHCVVGDARNLIKFNHGDFDLIFSNSVIEHVGDFINQRLMASEIHRISNCYFVQTPNYHFPMEPHFHVPFFQMMPLEVRATLIQNFSLGCMPKIGRKNDARKLAEDTRLLTKKEFASLFPDATIHEEKLFGLSKSLIAIK